MLAIFCRAKTIVVPSTLTRCIIIKTCALLCSYEAFTRYFYFQHKLLSARDHNKNCWDQPADLTVNCSTPLLYTLHLFSSLKTGSNLKERLPRYPLLYGYRFPISLLIRNHFYNMSCSFCLKCTMMRVLQHRHIILSHLNPEYEPYTNLHLVYRYMVDCFITFMLLYCIISFIWFILLIEHTCNFSWNFQKIICFTSRYCKTPIFPTNTPVWANSRALILNIQETTDHFFEENHSG